MHPKNDTSAVIDDFVMKHIRGFANVLVIADSFDDCQAAMYPTEFFEFFKSERNAHRLVLN